MRILKITLIILLIIPKISIADDQLERNKITKNLRCLICQGQSVYDSDSDFANSMKILVDKKLEEGLSENQIYDFFKEKYGEWILYDPGLNKNTYILWLLPILIFLLGGAIIIKKLKFKI
ncbi:cytochrome c-type biogenesis protein [Candidatus Pelagibacter sp. HIMB1485]|uniref:cytochrome c-type biogenesis protein n=1 Tax=Candidatus Pelagibacter sp. HIMB1485 TaxID=3415415 RepID=UPI003F854E23